MNELDPSETNTAPEATTNPPVIGPPRHPVRNTIAGIGASLLVIAMGIYFGYYRQHDRVATDRLSQFLTAYSQTCAIPAFTDKIPPTLRKIYVDSRQLQAVIDQQLKALESGATCASVDKVLNAAQFPMPPHADTIERPTITLQPQATQTN